MIELKDLTKKYGDFKAVNDLNLCVKKGEVFGFIGPNGAGKTTTIKMMSGILEPTRGTVSIAGIKMQDEPEKAKSNRLYSGSTVPVRKAQRHDGHGRGGG